MMTASGNVSLRPPSSGSRSPSPAPIDAGRAQAGGAGMGSARQSMGPGSRPTGFAGPPLSPRVGGGGQGSARPTSELLGSNINFQTPEAEAIDQWFENLQNYEATLEDMAAASLDVNFKEELSAIEQWFKVLSEAERTAALYSLLQHSTQVQIRFFITVLQQMARSDPMTALLSPAVGGSMQQQMEAKLAQMNLKSPGIKSGMPTSPVARSFSGSAAARGAGLTEPPLSPGFLSPDVARDRVNSDHDAAGVLAQKRAQLKATNAAHRISAPALSTMGNVWGANGGSNLENVAEKPPSSPTAQELTIPAPSSNARPKSTDFAGLANTLRSPRPGQDSGTGAAQEAILSPMMGDSWASMVNTPLIPMFQNTRNSTSSLDAAASKLSDWNGSQNGPRAPSNGVPVLDDAKKFRRVSKDEGGPGGQNNSALGNNTQRTPSAGSWRGGGGGGSNSGHGGLGNGANWTGAKSPALSAVSSSRMAGSDDGSMAGLGMNVGAFGMQGMGSPGLMAGMPGMQNMANMQNMQQQMASMAGMPGMMQGMNPFMMANMANMAQMGITPEAQLLAAQMAASGFVGQGGLSPFGNLAALQAQQLAAGAMAGRGGQQRMGRSPGPGGRAPAGGSGASAAGGGGGGAKGGEEDVDPRLLEDIPGWLRSLRLHKYTPNFENANWRDMVIMDEAALEAKGVAALGARRKMLKTFEIVRKKMGIPEPEGYVPLAD